MDYLFIEYKNGYDDDVNSRFFDHDTESSGSGSVLNVPITEVEDFTVRMKNALLFMGVSHVAHLVKLSRVQLITAPGIGVKGRSLVQKYLQDMQLVNVEESTDDQKTWELGAANHVN
ncbi:hypothetical protein BDD43_0031 [Mucilaginibacter gracilis]|uniref:RNA polymerase alpha subunit n=1 Tax=Mucilaginibacter gracilis TaxID=423350 RepID=A0A495IT39_9SPHI|nr:hypothetical protein [Mucilaginibacter gracilis]RKR79945.1 hypothetical protein BDD43_0031 [Mucilaginibacter gracilis]